MKAKEFSFSFREFVPFLHNTLEMSVMAGTEAEDLLAVRDLIQHAYLEVKELRNILSVIYQVGFIIPLIVQLVFGYYASLIVVVCNVLCLITQGAITVSEFRSMISRPNPCTYFYEI